MGVDSTLGCRMRERRQRTRTELETGWDKAPSRKENRSPLTCEIVGALEFEDEGESIFRNRPWS